MKTLIDLHLTMFLSSETMLNVNNQRLWTFGKGHFRNIIIIIITYVVKGLLPSNSARYTKSVELHYERGKMTQRFLLLRVSC